MRGVIKITLLTNFAKSITDFEYYKYFTQQKLYKAIIYILVFASVLGILSSIKPVLEYNKGINMFEENLMEDIQFTLSNGILSTEFDEVKIIEENGFVFYINTIEAYDPSLIEEYNQGIFLFEDRMIQKDSNYRSSQFKFEELSAINLNNENLAKLAPFFKLFIPVIIFIFIFINIILKSITILFMSLIGIMFSSILRANLNYKKILIISIYSITAASLFKFFLNNANIVIPLFLLPYYGLISIYLWHGIKVNKNIN